ncbi:hypothetical protein BH23CHL5_BH23CHL5_26380 [soil metagenome]
MKSDGPGHPNLEMPTQTRSGSTIPSTVSPIVGRDDSVETITNLLLREHSRLITLTGPGGIGKTRLAVEIAWRLNQSFQQGVTFIELEAVQHAELVPLSIARALDIPGRLTDAERTIADWLSLEERLLVLDNFERVMDAVPLVSRLLSSCPSIRILVTSRIAPLRLAGERVLVLGPIAFPADHDAPDYFSVAESPAVHYFLQHAPEVILEDSWRAVARICQRLDGIPLALELAGARVGLLSVEEIASTSSSWIPLLSIGRRDAPERHRSMDAAIRWSFDLLPADVRPKFLDLARFVGGFTRESASKVAMITPEDLSIFLESRLVEGSLEPSETRRFRLHEPVRDFCQAMLEESGNSLSLDRQFCQWALEVSRSMAPNLFDTHLYNSDGLELESLIEREYPNLTTALEILLDQGDVLEALGLAGFLTDYWYRRWYPAEGLRWTTLVIEQATGTPLDRTREYVKACLGQAILAQLIADSETAENSVQRAFTVAQLLDDKTSIAESLATIGYLSLNRGDIDVCELTTVQALEIFSQQAYLDVPWQADAHANLAQAAVIRGDVEDAAAHAEHSVDLARNVGDARTIATTLYSLGDVRCHQKRLPEALAAFEEAHTIVNTWHTQRRTMQLYQALHGLASCVTMIAFDSPGARPILRNLILQTESLCAQAGVAMPENRLSYSEIKHAIFGPEYIAAVAPGQPLSVVSLHDSIVTVEAIFRMMHQNLSTGRRFSDSSSDECSADEQSPVGPLFKANATSDITALTPLQLETVRLIVEGLTIKEIAMTHQVNEKSVYERLERVRERWNLQAHATMAEIAVFAVRQRVV